MHENTFASVPSGQIEVAREHVSWVGTANNGRVKITSPSAARIRPIWLFSSRVVGIVASHVERASQDQVVTKLVEHRIRCLQLMIQMAELSARVAQEQPSREPVIGCTEV